MLLFLFPFVAQRFILHKCFCQWVPTLQQVSGPGPSRNAVAWKAVSGAIVAQVCKSVRLSADLSSHCHLTEQTSRGGKKEKLWLMQPRVKEDMKEVLFGFVRKKRNRVKSVSLCERES